MDELDELIANALREATDTQFRDDNYNNGVFDGFDKIEDEYGWEIESLDEYDLDEYK